MEAGEATLARVVPAAAEEAAALASLSLDGAPAVRAVHPVKVAKVVKLAMAASGR